MLQEQVRFLVFLKCCIFYYSVESIVTLQRVVSGSANGKTTNKGLYG